MRTGLHLHHRLHRHHSSWGVTGPVFGYSDTWQLIINTGTTIVTFLMVFLMQNTQNRDTVSIQLKLDELIRANENARNAMLSLEDLTEEQLKRVKATFELLPTQRRLYSANLRKRANTSPTPARRLQKLKIRCSTQSMSRRRYQTLTIMRSSRDRFSPRCDITLALSKRFQRSKWGHYHEQSSTDPSRR